MREAIWVDSNSGMALIPAEVFDFVADLEEEGQSDMAAAFLDGWLSRQALTPCSTQRPRKPHARVTNAKRRAKRAGVELWSGLLNPRVTAASIADIEWALKDTGRWGRVSLPEADETTDEGYWCVRNSRGDPGRLEVKDALRAYQACGRDREKLVSLLEVSIEYRWLPSNLAGVEHLSKAGWARVAKGLHWLHNVAGMPAWSENVSAAAVRFLSRVPEPLRWALLPERSRQSLSLRSLSWQRYQAARKSAAVRLKAMPASVQWRLLAGFELPRGFVGFPLHKFRMGTLRALLPVAGLRLEGQNLAVIAGLSVEGQLGALAKLVRLLGAEGAVRQFVNARGFSWDAQGIHEAGQFKLPAIDWTPELWAPLCLRHPEAVHYGAQFAALEKKECFPKSLAELRRAVVQLDYPAIKPGFERLAELCHAEKLDGATFAMYQKFWSTVTVKPAEFLPHVEVRSEDLATPASGWRFFRLASDDLRGPLLGELTGCCQHLGGVGSACAKHGVVSPFSAFYVVTHGDKVIVQSWAWLTQSAHIVFDSLESRVRDAGQLEVAFRLFREGAKKLVASAFGIRGVYLGETGYGVTGLARKFFYGDNTPKGVSKVPADECSYYDGNVHTLLEGDSGADKSRLPAVEGYAASRRRRRTRPTVPELVFENPELTRWLSNAEIESEMEEEEAFWRLGV